MLPKMKIDKSKMGVILIGVLVVVLLISFGAGFYVIYSSINSMSDEPETIVIKEEELSMSEILNFDVTGENAILTNLMMGPDGRTHVIQLKVSLGINQKADLAVESAELQAILSSQLLAINDIIIGVCRSKTYEELQINDARQILKNELLLKLKDIFKTDLIVDVYVPYLYID